MKYRTPAVQFSRIILPRSGYLDAIGQRLKEYPVLALPGPRQVGKTTLARLYAESQGSLPNSSFRQPRAKLCETLNKGSFNSMTLREARLKSFDFGI